MEVSLPKQDIIGAKLVDVCHSEYMESVVIIEGLGDTQFRSHFVVLENGIVLNVFRAQIIQDKLPGITRPGETVGIPAYELFGRRVVALARDNIEDTLAILDGDLFLRDTTDLHGNPLLADSLRNAYSNEGLEQMIDYWTEEPLGLDSSGITKKER